MQKNEWKNSLLKSGLPLEHLVSELLYELDIYVSGEYSYMRSNEAGIETEFSVDLSAFEFIGKRDFEWATINYLIECKYTSPGIVWLFAPLTNNEVGILDIVHVNQDLTTKNVDITALNEWEDQYVFCTKGIELQSKNVNPNTISRGLNQIRYAVPQYMARINDSQSKAFHEEELRIEFLCPILVTTADIRILKRNLNIDDYLNSKDIDEISERVEILIHSKPKGPHLYQYTNQIIKNLFNNNNEIEERIKILQELKDNKSIFPDYLKGTWDIEFNIHSSVENVFVISYSYLKKLISDIRSSISECGTTINNFARLNFDIEKRTVDIVKTNKKA